VKKVLILHCQTTTKRLAQRSLTYCHNLLTFLICLTIMLKLAKNGENFRKVFSASNVGAKFETFNSAVFEIVDYKKSHYTWDGIPKDGEKTEVKLKNAKGSVTTWKTDAFREEFCPDYVKGPKEHKEKKVLTFAEVFETFKQLAQIATFDEIGDALIFIQDLEAKRRKEKEEAEEKEFASLEKRYKELLAKRTPKPETKKGKGKK
jgi:hypothetical protein